MDHELYLSVTTGTPKIGELMRNPYYQQKANQVAKGNNTILHLASLSGDMKSITYILKEFKHLLVRTNSREETPLHLAARKGDFDATRALIDAANEQNLSSQDFLVKCNVDLDTALHLAVQSGDFLTANEIVLTDQLFRYGENHNKMTPMYAAVEVNDRNIIHLMYTYSGKPLCLGGPDGRTALHAAIETRNKEFVDYILREQTSIVRVADDKGWTAFHYAAFHDWPDIISNLVQSMKEIEKDMGYLKSYRNGGIKIAIKEGNLSVLFEFLKDMDIPEDLFEEKTGITILHTAVEHNQRDIVEYILQNVESTSILNARDYKDGNTALHLSVMHGNFFPDLINRIKVEDLTLKNEANLTAYDLLYVHGEIQHDQLKIKDALEAIQSNHRWKLKFWQKNKLELSSEKGFKEKGKRFRKNIKFELARKESVEGKLVELCKKRTNTQIIVAALITTVAFTVGFTMPGGYNQSGQVEQGYAVLSKKKAFAVFMAADAMALLFSTASLFLYFLSSLYENIQRVSTHILISTILNIFSIVAMMATFMMGTVVVLAQSTLLTVFVYVISSIFFLFVVIALLMYEYDRQHGMVNI